MTPTFSVIIPTHNRAHTLDRAIQSIPSTVNVIVIDDGSTDNTTDIVRKYPNVTYIFQKNTGVSAARNVGINYCNQDYIAFLDSDDEFTPGKFNYRPVSRITYTDQHFTHNGSRINKHMRHLQKSGDLFDRLLQQCHIYPSTLVVRRDVFDNVGLFDESLPSSEDVNWLIRAAAHFTVEFIPKKHTTIHQKHGSHLSNLDNYKQSLQRLLDYNFTPQQLAMIEQRIEQLNT